VVAPRPPRHANWIQAHKSLLAALPWAKERAPILLLAPMEGGAGHASLLPWFEAGRLDRHLAALRREFHPYGLTAYSLRRIAADHPVHVASRMARDLVRPMGFLPHREPDQALAHVLREHAPIGSVAVIEG